VHQTPTGSSWLNQVERFFALLTDKQIWRGIYRCVAAFRPDITTFIDRHNADPKPFRWSKSADEIVASIERFCRYNAPAKHDAMSRTFGSGHWSHSTGSYQTGAIQVIPASSRPSSKSIPVPRAPIAAPSTPAISSSRLHALRCRKHALAAR
jgi:hypothetical protein